MNVTAQALHAPSASPFREAMTPAQILFGLSGRLPRRAWWLWGVLLLLGINLLGTMFLAIAGVAPDQTKGVLSLVVGWPCIAVSVKRFHDRNKSGWWVLINLIPVVGVLWTLVENGLLRGSVGPNRFGEDLTGKL
jgi:uncharacterized membrane protein YhaH (DUF805 family)